MGSTTTTLDNKEKKKKQNTSSSLILCFTSKCFPISSSTTPSSSSRSMLPPPSLPEYEYSGELPIPSKPSSTTTGVRKPGGWKSMPYILGMETFERLATIGLLANFTVFLMTVFHMTQVGASNLMNIWSGITNFAPLVGAFISDAYFGKFWVIAFSSFASLLGMVTMTVISLMPRLHPPTCKPHISECRGPTTPQMTFLVLALGFLSIGTGGIRPCSIPFGVDQFDPTTDEGRKGINSFFNWYYTTFTVVLIIALTLVVYIQDSVSWVWGFGIPTLLMMSAIVLYFVGTRLYVYVKPQGSIFSGIAQACVAAFKKRKVELPPDGGKEAGEFYDPPLIEGTYPIPKLPLTNRFRFLNKAARILDGDLKPDGSRVNPYRLASIQQIEEVKCIIKVVPVLASSLVCFVAMAQQTTFTISQALTMNRHLGPNFQIPPGSLGVISMITIGIWLPFYDRILVPKLRKITKIEGGITLLQRIGIGIFFSIIAMIVAGLVERMRRDSALSHNGPNGPAPLSVFWLAPQLVLMGFAEAFNIIGQIEFYYKEFPENMKSVANSLFSVTGGVASYLSTALVVTVHNVTGRKGHPDWLTKNINEGRVDYFYYLIAGLGFLNLIYFLIIAPQYQYTSRMKIDEDESQFDLELNDIKKKTETP